MGSVVLSCVPVRLVLLRRLGCGSFWSVLAGRGVFRYGMSRRLSCVGASLGKFWRLS